MDYKGAMGVPITFIDKFSPDQFEILNSNDIRKNDKVPYKAHGLIKDKESTINGKSTYVRIVIQKIRNYENRTQRNSRKRIIKWLQRQQ